MRTAIGISEHNGWAELVTVSVGGSGAPVVLDRRRAPLVDAGLPSNPYHHEGLVLPLAEAEALVARVERSVAGHARAVLEELRTAHGAEAVTLRLSPFERLPDALADVLASWALTCAADGMMYREALASAAADLGLHVDRYPRKTDPVAAAAGVLDVPVSRLTEVLSELGRAVGRPWTKEHREAAAGAIRVLAARTTVRI